MTKKYLLALAAYLVIAPEFVQLVAIEAAPQPSKRSAIESSLPDCLDSDSNIATIQNAQNANRKNASKYDGYRSVLQAITDLELAARLAYAETLAANCPTQRDQIMDLIAGVIGNRIRIRHGDIKSVVYQRDQFASSLNIYAESRYRDFLCPNDGALWNKIVPKMRANFDGATRNASMPKDAVNYYLYKHGERFRAPAWKLEEVLMSDEKLQECIRVFRNPAWK